MTMQAEARGDFCGRDQHPAELGKETLATEHPVGTPTHGPAPETPGAPAEEQGGIPIPSTSLLQVTERRRECGPVWASPACPWHPLPVPGASAVPYLSPGSLPASADPRLSLESPACPKGPLPALSIPCLSLGSLPVPSIPCLSLSSPASPSLPHRLPGSPSISPSARPQGATPGSGRVPERGRLPAEPLSSVSSLEVHFDLLDLTELTDVSDQELAEVFADSDEENVAGELPGGERVGPAAACPSRPVHPSIPEPSVPAGLQLQAVPRAGYLRSPSWTRAREQGREKKHLSDPELPPGPPDACLPAERPREP